MKENFFTENADILFHYNRFDFKEIFEYMSKQDKDAISAHSAEDVKKTWYTVLESLGDIGANVVAPNFRKVESEKWTLVDGKAKRPETLQKHVNLLLELGASSLCVSTEYGGLGAPFLIEMVLCELLNRACPSTMLNVGWYANIAHIIEKFASKELQNIYLPQIAEGKMSGNMALTEPDAGSDLGNIRTYASKNQDGSVSLSGSKCFITNGTSELSLVLAQSEKGATGLDTLSLYLCPKEINGTENYRITKLEDKMGLKGSATAELVYNASKAWLIGKENEGFKIMLNLMNDSRIAVSFQGIGLMEEALAAAKTYTQERKTWGKPIAQHELVFEKLLDMEIELKTCRSILYQTAYIQSVNNFMEAAIRRDEVTNKSELKEKIAKNNRKLRDLTPLLKYWLGERSFRFARDALQLHGGNGYMTEYKPEWLVRESIIYSLYEGTSQIQALMAMKDSIKEVLRAPKAFIERSVALRLKSLSEKDDLKRQYLRMRVDLQSALMSILFKVVKSNVRPVVSEASSYDILKIVKLFKTKLSQAENLSHALLHAERFIEIKCLVRFSSQLLRDKNTDPKREWIAKRFIHKASLRIAYLKAQIEQDEAVILEELAKLKEPSTEKD